MSVKGKVTSIGQGSQLKPREGLKIIRPKLVEENQPQTQATIRETQASKPQKETSTSCIMFCPYTLGSLLKKQLVTTVDFMNRNAKFGRVRIVERAGP